MRIERTKQTFRLRFLAFVLALALVWYSLNPAPRPVIHKKREVEPPDEKQRYAVPGSIPAKLPTMFEPTSRVAEPFLLSADDDDDFEWPEFIDG